MKTSTAWIAALCLAVGVIAKTMAPVQEIELKDIDGKPTSLGAYAGKTVLLVNVASKCGYTPQYKQLEEVYRKYKEKGLVVVGVPSNDFGGQEPGSAKEIKEFCSSKFDVTFPLMEKVKVTGAEKHPLYGYLTSEKSGFPGEVKWNFGKFLIGPDGKVLARWDSKVKPDDAQVIEAIEKSLAKK
jgi:glutathione peroxidase